jgi:hypothetical protein
VRIVGYSPIGFNPAHRSVSIERDRLKVYDRAPYFDGKDDHLTKAALWAACHFDPKNKKVLTFDETLAYVLKSDCASASPGFPWSGMGFKTKKEALQDPVVLDYLREYVAKLGTYTMGSLWALTLKDEMLKLTKIKERRTRLFTLAPLEHHFACVMYFSSLHDSIMKGANWCAAGKDMKHGGWHQMLKRLWEKGAMYVGTDGEDYDASMDVTAFNLLCIILEMWLGSKEAVREILSQACFRLVCASDGQSYYSAGGNPSGWFLTLLFNTIMLYVILARAYLRKHPDATRQAFELFVRALLCGDDSLVRLSADCPITVENIIDSFEDFGVRVKSSPASRNLYELEFCGAHSVLVHGVYVRSPRVQKFLDSQCFMKTSYPKDWYERACSVRTELWPVPEFEYLEKFCDHLEEAYPYLLAYRSQRLPIYELRYLHTGLE